MRIRICLEALLAIWQFCTENGQWPVVIFKSEVHYLTSLSLYVGHLCHGLLQQRLLQDHTDS